MKLRCGLLGLRPSVDAARQLAALGHPSNNTFLSGTNWQHQSLNSQQRGLATLRKDEGLPLDTGRKRLVILGAGWAAARLARDINPYYYDFTVQLCSIVLCSLSSSLGSHCQLDLPVDIIFLPAADRLSAQPHGIYTLAHKRLCGNPGAPIGGCASH
jgi:hypothetical protein